MVRTASRPATRPRQPPITVELLKVEPQLLRDTATFSGQLDAEYSVELKAETSGVIEAVLFEEGQTVKKGAVLFRLRDDEQKARLNEAVANRDLAQEVWDRTQQLVSRDAASAAQKDRATAELRWPRRASTWRALALDRTRIAAPFDGVVGARCVAPGDRITDKKALVRIDAIDRLQLSFADQRAGRRVRAHGREARGARAPVSRRGLSRRGLLRLAVARSGDAPDDPEGLGAQRRPPAASRACSRTSTSRSRSARTRC